MRPHARPARGHVEAGRAVDAVAIEQGHGGQLQLGGALDERFGQGSTLEEAEGGAGVEFGVEHGGCPGSEEGRCIRLFFA